MRIKNLELRIKNCQTGFSLIELMVTITIFVIITSITLTNYPKFGNKLSLDLLAQDIALSLRQAQISGSSVLGSRSGGTGSPRVFGAYGVHFEAPRSDGGSANFTYPYLLFADITPTSNVMKYDGPSAYDFSQELTCDEPQLSDLNNGGSPNECLQRFLISGFNKVKVLCSNFESSGVDADKRVDNCLNNPDNQIGVLDIIFIRPNLDAKFTIGDGINPPVGSFGSVSNVGIVLESPRGDYRATVVVWKTGQISVE